MCCPFEQSYSPKVGKESWLMGPQGRVMCPLLFILDASEMFELIENRLFAYADDSTLLAGVHKPADRPAVSASLNMDMARIQEWCNHWQMILNPNKTKALVVVVVGQTVGSISSKTLAYDCLCTFELC